jgi:hypothetical protein
VPIPIGLDLHTHSEKIGKCFDATPVCANEHHRRR